MIDDTKDYAKYIRASTDTQEKSHQMHDLDRWLEENTAIDPTEITNYVDLDVSGSTRDREDYLELLDRIKNGELDHVVVWEISRIGRRGSIIQEFFDACEDNGVTVHITNGKVDKIKPDGTNRFVADVVGMVYTEERRQIIRRTKSGLRRARREGKWLGQTPTGFARSDEGYLHPNLSPDYEEGETSYLDVVRALEAIEDGASYREAAREIPNCTRQTLMNIHKDDERRRWYLEEEAEDERVDAALDEIDRADD
ncbi:recombinase family protein [Natronorubrum thiooxidans]|uniref:Resolvase, N terminal domain n=1 Tax=Natronorubrum thiooxidans TaxID=308853 RepID=A0A1N7H252_9EURY|nr:recombinase family protein [Natronorubrum thiooxidans]SIS18937.1 Resolvase, N terminal domain [Natronorubrum thiooxidans]